MARRCALLTAFALACHGAATVRAARPQGTLVLDMAAPFVQATIAGVPLRLRVDPGQWATVEVTGDVADRLPLRWEAGEDVEVGRTVLPGRVAQAPLALAGGAASRPVTVASHERPLATDADGVIGPDLLPYAEIVWRNRQSGDDGQPRTLPLDWSADRGLEASDPALPAGLHLHFGWLAATSVATAAAGASIARACGGGWAGGARDAPAAFGLPRPVRPLACPVPVFAAGFRFDSVPVRIADFRGDAALPGDPAAAADIVVSRRVAPQHGEAWLQIGADRLSRCTEVAYIARPRSLRLRCRFDR